MTRPLAWAALVVLCTAGLGSARADSARPVAGQAAAVPLATRVTEADEAAIRAAFRFEGFDKARVLALRPRFAALAAGNDPVAQYLLGRTYDLFEFGQGDPADAKVALEFYGKAAAQRYAAAEMFLYRVYQHGLMHMATDEVRARAFLDRAYQHAAGPAKADIALELAHTTKEPLRYLQEALELAPDNQTAIDWLFSEYLERKELKRALPLAERSRNYTVWEKAGSILLAGGPGVPADRARAVMLLMLAATEELKEEGSASSALMTLYSLVCKKLITKESLGALNRSESWAVFNQFQKNCVVEPGG